MRHYELGQLVKEAIWPFSRKRQRPDAGQAYQQAQQRMSADLQKDSPYARGEALSLLQNMHPRIYRETMAANTGFKAPTPQRSAASMKRYIKHLYDTEGKDVAMKALKDMHQQNPQMVAQLRQQTAPSAARLARQGVPKQPGMSPTKYTGPGIKGTVMAPKGTGPMGPGASTPAVAAKPAAPKPVTTAKTPSMPKMPKPPSMPKVVTASYQMPKAAAAPEEEERRSRLPHVLGGLAAAGGLGLGGYGLYKYLKGRQPQAGAMPPLPDSLTQGPPPIDMPAPPAGMSQGPPPIDMPEPPIKMPYLSDYEPPSVNTNVMNKVREFFPMLEGPDTNIMNRLQREFDASEEELLNWKPPTASTNAPVAPTNTPPPAQSHGGSGFMRGMLEHINKGRGL